MSGMSIKVGASLLLLAGVLGAQGAPTRRDAPRLDPSKIPTVTLCDLMSRPEEYHGKEIRVRAQYNLGFEWSYFDDSSCKNYAVETTPYRVGNVVWAEFDKSVDSSSRPEIRQKLAGARSLCCPSGWHTSRTELLVSGKLFKAGEGGFGHLGRYALKLVVGRVEEVGATKVDNPEP
jgi:hypothetical protein